MTFDLVSFFVGIVAGAMTGLLAGYLHETEAIGELQERVRVSTLQLDRIKSEPRLGEGHESEYADLNSQLQDLQNEIKKLYRRRSR